MALTEKCLPMSRRKSRADICPIQSALLTSCGAASPFAGRQQRFYLGRQAGYPALHRLGAVEVALGRLEAGIADKAGGTAHQCHRGVTRQLKAAQHQQRHQMADVQAAGGGIEPAVDGAWGSEMVGQRHRVGILGYQATSGQLIEQVGVDHGVSNSRGKATSSPLWLVPNMSSRGQFATRASIRLLCDHRGSLPATRKPSP